MTERGEARLRPTIFQLNYHQLRQLATAIADEAAGPADRVVLDVGCGSKPYAPLFPGRYVGLDLGLGHGAPDCLGVAEDLPTRSGSVDVVLSTQSLEHADDPGAVLEEARRVLRPDGKLLLSTHGTWVHHPDPHDYWRWTEEGLVRLFAGHGLVVDRVYRQGELFLTGLLLASYPIGAAGRTTRRPLVRLVAALGVAAVNLLGFPLEWLAGRLPRHYASVSYLVVAHPAG